MRKEGRERNGMRKTADAMQYGVIPFRLSGRETQGGEALLQAGHGGGFSD
jgi:hypothetical protein